MNKKVSFIFLFDKCIVFSDITAAPVCENANNRNCNMFWLECLYCDNTTGSYKFVQFFTLPEKQFFQG